MAVIALHNQTNSDMLIIPGIFIDKYLPSASGTDVKVYLYALRSLQSGALFSMSSLSDVLDLSEKEILRSFSNWERLGLLRLSFSSDHELNGISFLPVMVQAEVQPGVIERSLNLLTSPSNTSQMSIPAPVLEAVGASQPYPAEAAPAAVREAAPAKDSPADKPVLFASQKQSSGAFRQTSEEKPADVLPSQADIASLDNDSIFNTYLAAWAVHFSRPLTRPDVEKLSYWYLVFGRSDLMDYLIEYCKERGQANIRQIEATAKDWHRKGYQTAQQAMESEQERQRKELTEAVMKELALTGDPAPAHIDMVSKWLNHYGFTPDMILLACRRTIESATKPNFKYVNSILERWFSESIMTPEAAAKQEEAHAQSRQAGENADKDRPKGKTREKQKNIRQFNDYPQRDTDYDRIFLGKN